MVIEDNGAEALLDLCYDLPCAFWKLPSALCLLHLVRGKEVGKGIGDKPGC